MLKMFRTYSGFHPIFTYTPSKCRCSSPSGNLMSCSLLTLSYLSCGDVIYGISCFCSLGYLSCGNVIYNATIVYLTTCTNVGTAFTTIDIANGSILPLIIFYALKSMVSCSFFIPELHALSFSIMFFLLKALFREPIVVFFSII
jgi:hypothetical protein